MQDAFFDAGKDFGMQLVMDCWQIVLNDRDIMGNGAIGAERMKKIFFAVSATVYKYFDAANTNNPEADVLQEKMDARLRKIWKEKTVPFEERYTMLKKCKY